MNTFPSKALVYGHRHTIVHNLVEGTYERLENEHFSDLMPTVNPKQLSDENLAPWETPSYIDNSIIELSRANQLLTKDQKLNELFEALQSVICKNLVLVIREPVTLTDMKRILESSEGYCFSSITLLMTYDESLYCNEFSQLVLDTPSVFTCVFYESPFNKNFADLIYFVDNELGFTKLKKPFEFVANIPLYQEAIHFNPYFNKKLYIDEQGYIRNAPETSKHFGSIHADYDLKEVSQQTSFQQLWTVSKEQCDVCKDCEYRRMCVDNRVPKRRDERHWYFEDPCNYDPYTGEWQQ